MMPAVDCPVCGAPVAEQNAEISASHDAQTYYFDRTQCRDAFVRDPGRYVGNTGS